MKTSENELFDNISCGKLSHFKKGWIFHMFDNSVFIEFKYFFYIFHKIKSREIKNLEVPHFLSRIASILGLVIIISFALGITMAVITVVKLLD